MAVGLREHRFARLLAHHLQLRDALPAAGGKRGVQISAK
jgi:hypothetical protein